MLRLAKQDKCVLFSTHLLEQAEAICNRIGVIDQGRVIAEGTTAELCATTGTGNLREAFFALVGAKDLHPVAAAVAAAGGGASDSV